MAATNKKDPGVKKKSVPIAIQNKFIMGLFRKGYVEKPVIKEKFLKEYGTSVTTFDRRFRIVKKQWEKTVVAMEKKANDKIEQIQSKIAEGQILELIERKVIAGRIARGEPTVKNGRLSYPNFQDQIRALEYLSRVSGDYAPERHEFTHIHELLNKYTIDDSHATQAIPITSEKEALAVGDDIEFEELESTKNGPPVIKSNVKKKRKPAIKRKKKIPEKVVVKKMKK